MRQAVFIFFTICCLCSFSQKDLKGDLKTVSNIMKAQQLAWNNGDIRGFMSFYWNNDSLKFIGSKGLSYGWQKTLDNYIKSYPDKTAMGILKFTILSTEKLSKTSIYVIGKWGLDKEKPSGGHFTLLWKKIDNKWVIVADHTS
jgi:ketosteroid isomerase-like protein